MDRDVIERAIDHFGKESQILKAVEEMAELSAELMRSMNSVGMNVKIIEEIADVMIMLEQLKVIFGEELVGNHVQSKLKRLKSRMDEN
jgi:hypothetical protein